MPRKVNKSIFCFFLAIIFIIYLLLFSNTNVFKKESLYSRSSFKHVEKTTSYFISQMGVFSMKNRKFEIFNNSENLGIKNLTFVTAFTIDDIDKLLRSCLLLSNHKEVVQDSKVVAYFLGKEDKQKIKEKLKNLCSFLEIRNFDFERYPHFIQNLNEKRWKSLVLAEILDENPAVLWFDPGIAFRVRKETFHNLLASMTSHYYSCGFRAFFSTDRSLSSSINPKMKDHFFIDQSISKLNLISSASFLVTRSIPSLTVLEDMVKCSLTESCMNYKDGAINFSESNDFNNFSKNDDSLLSLTLAQCSRHLNYYLGPSELIVIEKNVKEYDWKKLKREYPSIN